MRYKLLIILFLGLGLNACQIKTEEVKTNPVITPPQSPKIVEGKMQITSSSFANNQAIPIKYTCDGENVNPPLVFVDIPLESKSLVLVVDDPDAPSGDWTHWLVYNLDPKTKEIAENAFPKEALIGKNDFGKDTYGGPCLPSGSHRYFFRLYALDVILTLKSGINKKELEQAMQSHILDQAELVGFYKKE